ncbi:hypothetical protein LAZ67_9003254 [Cordylochernes scorpioides]|uniref:Reverse transcriptase domain-containing protein n=1 Tax=Cordylochernes scorpioides TaxID=51811 RepID=A0ABY6KWF1_9ARAC|nr:hypothetical protein LAZ67_9003254 [Cordylochernes scorpioides]
MFDRITTTLPYADDLIITAKNKEDMDILLDALSDQATKAGLKVKPQNCATLHLLCRGRRRVLPTPFKVEEAPVPAMTKDESYLHLGVPTGFKKSRSLNSALQDLETVVKKIDESLLTPWQKIDVIKTFILIISLAKKWLNLLKRASNEVLYIPPSQGGAGLLPFRDRAELSKIAQAFKMLTSKDTNTENLAKIFLKRTVNRKLGRSASGEDMADYLSGRLDQGFDRDGGDVASLWSEARNATRRLRSTLRARWTWDPDRDQGKTFEVTCQSQCSNTFIPAGKYFRFADWRFVHRARLNLLPLNGAVKFGNRNKKCRRCGALNETLPHVLQHCRVHSAAWKRRHEAVLERLRKALRIKGEEFGSSGPPWNLLHPRRRLAWYCITSKEALEWTSRLPQWIPKPQRNSETPSCPRATPNGYRGSLTLQPRNHLHSWWKSRLRGESDSGTSDEPRGPAINQVTAPMPDCSTVEKRAQKSAPSTRSKKTPESDAAALEEPEHSTQPAAQEPISFMTPTGPPVELDQQNAPPLPLASDLSAEATPFRPEAHGTSLATSEADQTTFVPSLPENAAEEDQRESPLVQQEEEADDLQLSVVHSDPPTVQTPPVLDSVDLQAAAPPDDPAPLPQDTSVTPSSSFTARRVGWKVDSCTHRETLFSLIESFVKGVKNETGKPDTRTRRRAPPPQKPRSTRPSAPSFDAEKAAKLQRSYNINKNRTMQEILGQRSPGCTIPIQMIEEHFEKRMVGDNTEFSPDPDFLKDFAPQDGAQLEEPISSNAVWYRLLKMGNTAPGPDGISYQELKRVDPNATILTQIFQACFQMRTVPPSWMESSSILLHKKGDAEDLGNWRPIALGNTIAKLYTAVLAGRLRRLAATTGQLSKAQKGFMEFEGCLEHNFVVQSVIEETKKTSRQACFAWLDLENAFGSVPHEHIFNVLDAFGVPGKVFAVFRDLNTDFSTSIRTPLGITSPIPFKLGVKQGCPGSSTLFNVAIEVIVRTLASMAKDHGQGVSTSAPGHHRRSGGKDRTPLHLKGPKCAILHLDCRKKRTTLPTTFYIQEQPISAMRKEDTYWHFGVPTGFNKTRNPEEAIKGIKEDAKKIHSSLLAPWQKIDATKTFIYPRLDFILRGSPIHKTAFREVDLLIKRLGSACLNGPTTRTDLANIQHAFRLLTSPDSETSALAKSLLKRVAEWKLGRPALEEDLAAYLSGKLDGDFARDGGDITSLWSDARNVSRRLSKRIGVQWVHNPTLGDITIKLPNAGKTPKEISLPAGKVYEVTCRSKSFNGFINSGRYMRFADWRLIHSARLNGLPLIDVIIDVAIPIENRLVAFKDARERKISKYTPLANKLREKGWEVFLDAFLVGPLGGWDNDNEKVLRALDISPRYSTVMRKLSSGLGISTDILVVLTGSSGLLFFPKALWRQNAPPTTESWRYNHSGFGGNAYPHRVDALHSYLELALVSTLMVWEHPKLIVLLWKAIFTTWKDLNPHMEPTETLIGSSLLRSEAAQSITGLDQLEPSALEICEILGRATPSQEDKTTILKPLRENGPAHKSANYLKYSGEEAGRLQKAYNFNKKRTMQDILEGSSPLCNIPKKTLEAYFQKPISQKTTASRKEELRSLLAPANSNSTSEALDLLSKPISTKEPRIQMFDRITTTLPYADDLIITAKNKEDMDILLDALSDQATKAGLKVKPQNCATLHLLCRGRRRVLPTPFKVEEAPVPAMTKDESYLHLGVPTGFKKSRSLNSALQDLETVVKKIDESLLTPWQKIDVIKTFMYPKLDFILRGAPIPQDQGGAGLLPFRDRAELSKIAQAFKMLTSKDTNTENLAKIFLKRTVNRKLGRSASGEDMADYLSAAWKRRHEAVLERPKEGSEDQRGGGWDNKNERVLKMLQVSPRYAKLMRQLMCTDSIEWSRDIYVEHISGKRQYQ